MRDNSERARRAVYMIMAVMAMDVLMFGSSFMQLNLLNDLSAGVDVPDAELDANDLREVIIGGLYTIVYIASGVMYIQWFRRAYWNLHTQADKLSFTEGWAAGSWFVPILNLFRPYRIMKELFTVTNDLLRSEKGISFGRKSHGLLGAWWTLWVITSVVSNMVTRFTLQAETIEDFMLSSQLSMVSSVLTVPLGFVAIKVVKDYAALEYKLYRRSKDGNGPLLDLSGDSTVIDTFY